MVFWRLLPYCDSERRACWRTAGGHSYEVRQGLNLDSKYIKMNLLSNCCELLLSAQVYLHLPILVSFLFSEILGF